MEKANKILEDVICIIAVIIFPLFLLRILGFERLAFEKSVDNNEDSIW